MRSHRAVVIEQLSACVKQNPASPLWADIGWLLEYVESLESSVADAERHRARLDEEIQSLRLENLRLRSTNGGPYCWCGAKVGMTSKGLYCRADHAHDWQNTGGKHRRNEPRRNG